jgi:beta-glucosidase
MFPVLKRNLRSAYRVLRHLIAAHKGTYKLIHDHFPNAKVGISCHLIYFKPKRPKHVPDKFLVRFLHWLNNEWFINSVRSSMDFIGLQYYIGVEMTFNLASYVFKNLKSGSDERKVITALFENSEDKDDLGREICPKGIYKLLLDLRKYNLPIIITENGVADATDHIRKKFIQDHLAQVFAAIRDGVDVRGYIYWTLMDNFEWTYGRTVRFGLVEIDYEQDLKRIVRPSAYAFAKICQNNSIILE